MIGRESLRVEHLNSLGYICKRCSEENVAHHTNCSGCELVTKRVLQEFIVEKATLRRGKCRSKPADKILGFLRPERASD
ncbi:predicted protein [Sclerotinia sclerotiorum 1980 UF-70]|uniref:Uncharacterized protein n=1 Tax=Sclerotinia sclerotiorum (strain ATCC 18683 / 1980 / Ss-1) TaxID=665079 RepID=A7F5A9_SCLS1|nr:predicted protein [Sclerotinia sclerotiorum 1980 UF-70]EDN97930.1 predicted protein [Sclerotinia sclerotiorum 1980 UF-70]